MGQIILKKGDVMMKLKMISNKDFHKLQQGDTVYVKCGDNEFYRSEVIRSPFFNFNADEPNWEIETDNCFCDEFSVYVEE